MSQALTRLVEKLEPNAGSTVKSYAEYLRRGLVAVRAITGRCGPLPHFLIIGAQKSGTSSLYHWLCMHPRIAAARVKEIHFFDRHWRNGSRWYRANFPDVREGRITGEATPSYIFMPEVPARVAATLGQRGKFVVLLRNPVDRAISHFYHEQRLGNERLPIEQAFSMESCRLSAPHRKVGSLIDNRTANAAFSYFSRGLYAEQLERWFNVFTRDRFFIEASEVLFERPHETLERVCEFLGVGGMDIGRMDPKNVGSYNGVIPHSLHATLVRRYAEPNQRLAKLLGRSLPWT
jgi:hypothetical protein